MMGVNESAGDSLGLSARSLIFERRFPEGVFAERQTRSRDGLADPITQ